MVKRADAPYRSRRTEAWLKMKCQQRQEFVVIGFTDRAGAKQEVGGLLLAYYEEGVLHYAGMSGPGGAPQTAGRCTRCSARLRCPKPR